MRCKHCGVEVEFDTKICPICHEKLTLNSDEKLPSVYPPREPSVTPSKFKPSFNSVYLSLSLIIFIVALVLNLTLLPQVKWIFLVCGLLLYGFLLIHNTILSANSVGVKAFVQLVMLLLLLYLSEIIVKDLHPEKTAFWILDIGLPVLISLSLIAVCISTVFVYKQKKALLFDIIWLSLLGYVPIILYACKEITNPVASIVCASLSTVLILGTSIIFRKQLKDEVLRHFHI